MELLIQISEAVFWFLVIGLPANFIRYLAKHPDEKEKLLCALARLIKHAPDTPQAGSGSDEN